MVVLNNPPKTYSEATQILARWYGEDGEKDLKIYAFPDPEEKIVQLIEVSGIFPNSNEVVPFALGKSEEFPFRSSVALVTPSEWEKIQSKELPLPSGWDIEKKEEVWSNDRP